MLSLIFSNLPLLKQKIMMEVSQNPHKQRKKPRPRLDQHSLPCSNPRSLQVTVPVVQKKVKVRMKMKTVMVFLEKNSKTVNTANDSSPLPLLDLPKSICHRGPLLQGLR